MIYPGAGEAVLNNGPTAEAGGAGQELPPGVEPRASRCRSVIGAIQGGGSRQDLEQSVQLLQGEGLQADGLRLDAGGLCLEYDRGAVSQRLVDCKKYSGCSIVHFRGVPG